MSVDYELLVRGLAPRPSVISDLVEVLHPHAVQDCPVDPGFSGRSFLSSLPPYQRSVCAVVSAEMAYDLTGSHMAKECIDLAYKVLRGGLSNDDARLVLMELLRPRDVGLDIVHFDEDMHPLICAGKAGEFAAYSVVNPFRARSNLELSAMSFFFGRQAVFLSQGYSVDEIVDSNSTFCESYYKKWINRCKARLAFADVFTAEFG